MVRIVPPILMVIVAILMILVRRHISMLTSMSVRMMSWELSIGIPSLALKLVTWSIVLVVVVMASVIVAMF